MHGALVWLVDDEHPPHRVWEQPFFPGNRGQTWWELLNALGFPNRRVSVGELELTLSQGPIPATHVVFCNHLDAIDENTLAALSAQSHQQGLCLIGDSRLRGGRPLARAFGAVPNGLPRVVRHARDHSGADVIRNRRPFGPAGVALGLRPVLRWLLQPWLARDLRQSPGARVEALWDSGPPLLVSNHFGAARNLLFNGHPAQLGWQPGPFVGFIAKQLALSSPAPVVRVALDGLLALRIDDPGSPERSYLEGFNPGVMSAPLWHEVMRSLERYQAPLNVAYVPLWIDDGDARRGDLEVNAEPVSPRIAGSSYRAWQVNYRRRDGVGHYDYTAEYPALRQGVEEGRLCLLSHGLTHMSTDVEGWLKAPDRYTDMRWYREFREMKSQRRPSREELSDRLRRSTALLQEAFAVRPRTFVPSAHEETGATAAIAAAAGFRLVSSRYTHLLAAGPPRCTRKVASYYAGEDDALRRSIEAGLPSIFTFHDYDLYRHGSAWLERKLGQLKEWGVRQFITLDTLAELLQLELHSEYRDDTLSVRLMLAQDLTLQVPIAVPPQFQLQDHPATRQERNGWAVYEVATQGPLALSFRRIPDQAQH